MPLQRVLVLHLTSAQIMLFVLTMKRQIKHMIKHRYLPFTRGKVQRPLALRAHSRLTRRVLQPKPGARAGARRLRKTASECATYICETRRAIEGVWCVAPIMRARPSQRLPESSGSNLNSASAQPPPAVARVQAAPLLTSCAALGARASVRCEQWRWHKTTTTHAVVRQPDSSASQELSTPRRAAGAVEESRCALARSCASVCRHQVYLPWRAPPRSVSPRESPRAMEAAQPAGRS